LGNSLAAYSTARCVLRGLGEGDLAWLPGEVPTDQQSEFFTFTKDKFLLVFPSEKVTSEDVVAALAREMSTHPQFKAIK